MITSLFEIDRAVREASARLSRARRGLAARTSWEEDPPNAGAAGRAGAPCAPNPLARLRGVLAKDTYEEIGGVPDPLLVPALRAHVARLVLARVLWDDEVAIARAWSEPSVQLEDGLALPRMPAGTGAEIGGGLVAPRTLLAALLADGEDQRRRRVADAFARAVRERLRDPIRYHADRRARAAAQLGVSLDSVDLPAQAGWIEGAASRVIEGTSGLADRFAPWDRGLGRVIARDATKGWPAHLGPRWVLSIFGGTDLLRGVALEDVRLPAVLGGASFARALAAFGEAFGEACAPRGAPFAILRPSIDLRPLRIGALLGTLVGDRVFARRTLELGSGAAIDHGRAFARAGIASVRLACAAARTRASLFPPRDDLDDRFREETARAWGEPLPAELAGALPRAAHDAPARFVATMLAALDRKRMIEAFDEDWYRNPRSSEALRAIAETPQPEITEPLLGEAAGALVEALVSGAA